MKKLRLICWQEWVTIVLILKVLIKIVDYNTEFHLQINNCSLWEFYHYPVLCSLVLMNEKVALSFLISPFSLIFLQKLHTFSQFHIILSHVEINIHQFNSESNHNIPLRELSTDLDFAYAVKNQNRNMLTGWTKEKAIKMRAMHNFKRMLWLSEDLNESSQPSQTAYQSRTTLMLQIK